MTVNAMVAVAETDQAFPMQFHTEPQIGDVITLTVGESTSEYIVLEVDPTGFSNDAPYLYGVYVKPRA